MATHISGHPSAASRARDRESSSAEDRRSNHWATPTTRRTRPCGVMRLLVLVWLVAQIYERTHAEVTGPQEYYAAAGSQSMTGAEGGTQAAMMPAGVLRKQGMLSPLKCSYFLTVCVIEVLSKFCNHLKYPAPYPRTGSCHQSSFDCVLLHHKNSILWHLFSVVCSSLYVYIHVLHSNASLLFYCIV